MDPPFPKTHPRSFRIEPIAHSTILASLETNNSASFNPEAWDPVLFACEHYEVEYTAELKYVDGAQLHRINDRTFLAPIVNTKLNRSSDANNKILSQMKQIVRCV
ncbi:putative formylmethionine deformylase-like protein [Colletotrichum asianum]